ncbi:MAG: semialdehyde dehydrogenase, partial [Pseudopedobacter saltans]
MKALVIGATGATGKDLVNQLCQDSDFDEIDIFVRRRS